MSDLIKREDAIKAVLGLTMYKGSVPVDSVIFNIKKIPTANADRKTENCSEKPNNCDTCRNKGFEGCEQPCLGCGCCGLYEPKTEPQTDGYISGEDFLKIFDEPQTDCAWK